MKAKFLPIFLLLFSTTFFQFACQDGALPYSPPVPGKYATGIFVVNEGPFGGTGSISWHNPATGETVLDVFAQENNGAVLGQFVQSICFHNGHAYIVVNGANKVYVVDAETFKYQSTIEGLALPRFFLPLDNDYAYVSQWGADGLSGSVAKVDLRTNQIVKTISTGSGADKLVRLSDGLVYVPNSGGFGTDSTISVINPADDLEISRMAVHGKNPGTLAESNYQGQKISYAHCRGTFLDTMPEGWVGPLDGSAGFTTPAYGDDLVAGPGAQFLYFTAGGSIWKIGFPGGPSKVADQPAYGLNCDAETGNLYCADAKDFSSAGEVVVLSPVGQRIGAFSVGVAPGEVVIVK